MEGGSLFSVPCPAFIACRFFSDGHSDQCEVAPLCGFDFHFSHRKKWLWVMLSIFSCVCGLSVRLLWRNVCLDLPSIFWLCCLFDIELPEPLVYFEDKSFVSCFICKHFLPFRRLSPQDSFLSLQVKCQQDPACLSKDPRRQAMHLFVPRRPTGSGALVLGLTVAGLVHTVRLLPVCLLGGGRWCAAYWGELPHFWMSGCWAL